MNKIFMSSHHCSVICLGRICGNENINNNNIINSNNNNIINNNNNSIIIIIITYLN